MAISIPQISFRLALSRRYRERYREIISVALRHGFGFLVAQLGLARITPFYYRILGHPKRVEPYTQAEHLRLALEDLGTTFIKLGQIMSTRVDLLPPDYIRELEKLLDSVPPVDVTAIKRVIKQELGRDVDEIFSSFNPEPLASASIGQVHAAKLVTGEDVVVKVKRPGVQEQVTVDVDITLDLARIAGKRLSIGRYYDFEGIAREFTQTLLRELDYIQEGRNADRFHENFKGDERAYIPRIYWDYTTKAVIVMERISGIRINDIYALEEAGLDPKRVAGTSTDILFKQVFEHGFFHADPHPANFFVRPDEIIGIVDFGMVGYLDNETKTSLVELSIAVSDQDIDGIIDSYIDLGVIGRTERFDQLRNEVSTLIMQYYGLSVEEIDIRNILNDVTALVRRHNLRFPSNLALLIKTFSMQEGLVFQLDPSFKFTEALIPYARMIWRETYSPLALTKRYLETFTDLAYAGIRAPNQIRRIISQLSRGELTVVTNQPRLDEELSYINSIANRVIVSIASVFALVGAGVAVSVYMIRKDRGGKGSRGRGPGSRE